MRISDWSSDVCSSDLEALFFPDIGAAAGLVAALDQRCRYPRGLQPDRQRKAAETGTDERDFFHRVRLPTTAFRARRTGTGGLPAKIGRASGRERGCRAGSVSVGAWSFKKKK